MTGTRGFSWFLLVAGFLAATSLGLLLHIILVLGPSFQHLAHVPMLDFRLTGYEAADVGAMIVTLRQTPEAADLLRSMHLLEDMLLPLSYTALGLMVLARHAPGAMVFHKPLSGYRTGIVLVMPVLYGLADLTENIASLMIFPPANPAPETLTYLADLLPAATRLKAMFFFITLILMLRFTLFREKPAAGDDDKKRA